MSRKLAIKGHPTRGKEVIELLEMMGGKNIYKLLGNDRYAYCVIEGCQNEIRVGEYIFGDEDMCFFTLEEFLEKYPFKVGELNDLVDDHISCIITEMRWNEQAECVEYHAEFGSNDYGWYRAYEFCRDCLIEEPDEVISGIYLNSCDYADEVELNLGDYKIEVRDGRTFAVKKKPVYPKTIIEVLDYWHPNREPEDNYQHIYKKELIKSFQLLLYCYDAYRKIAGEQMELGKPWEPNWSTSEPKYVLACTCNGIEKQWETTYCKTFAFPTEEIRDAFYENFKDLIESCKELL